MGLFDNVFDKEIESIVDVSGGSDEGAALRSGESISTSTLPCTWFDDPCSVLQCHVPVFSIWNHWSGSRSFPSPSPTPRCSRQARKGDVMTFSCLSDDACSHCLGSPRLEACVGPCLHLSLCIRIAGTGESVSETQFRTQPPSPPLTTSQYRRSRMSSLCLAFFPHTTHRPRTRLPCCPRTISPSHHLATLRSPPLTPFHYVTVPFPIQHIALLNSRTLTVLPYVTVFPDSPSPPLTLLPSYPPPLYVPLTRGSFQGERRSAEKTRVGKWTT